MTAVMLATYPDVFAAGAVIAGLPYGIASSVRQALAGMFHSPTRSPSELGDLVRTASNHSGTWPRISVWHGSADRTVNPGNANEIVKQWLDVHGLPLAPMSEKTVDGYPHQVWWNAEGETVVESYTITGMAHGTPIGTAENEERYGAQGPFLIEAGISSSYRIAEFFGLTKWIRQKKELPSAKPIPAVSPLQGAPARAKRTRPREVEKEPEPQPRGRIDIGAVITRALTAAGLIKQ
jgi:poly(3-hydroxybutyrate) depolymerase